MSAYPLARRAFEATRCLAALLAVLVLGHAGAALSQTITTVAGRDVGDGSAATAAIVNYPVDVATDAAGNLYIADYFHYRVRKVAAGTGVITTVAGNGLYTHAGDGGAATSAGVDSPTGVAVDAAGNVYIATSNRVRKVTAATGKITTIAGTGTAGYSGDGGAATSAKLDSPKGLAVDASGNVYIADYGNNRIRKVTAATGTITTVAGSGTAGFAGDGGAATSAQLDGPYGVAVNATYLVIADYWNQRIRRVTLATGTIATVAGTGICCTTGDGGAATSAYLTAPKSVAFDAAGNIYLMNSASRVRKITVATGVITTVAGTGTSGFAGDGGSATSALIHLSSGIAVDASGGLFIADTYNQRVRKVSGGTISTLTGAGIVANVAAAGAGLSLPRGMALDAAGNLYVADSGNGRVRKVAASTGLVTTIAGDNLCCDTGDGGAATSAYLSSPAGVAVDSAGNVFVADNGDARVRRISATGTITTVAGNGLDGYAGDGGAATGASLNSPRGIARDSAGNLYIADYGNHRIRKVSTTGIITTVAGNGTGTYAGDGGSATSASLYYPTGVAVDGANNLYIADWYNNRIRKVSTSTGIITTVAGNGSCCFEGDAEAATNARVDPYGIAVDSAGNIFVTDYKSRIRRINASTGIILTVAGGSTQGDSGDGGAATNAKFQAPSDLAVDSAGNLYIADTYNNRVRKVARDTTAPETQGATPLATAASVGATFSFAGTDSAGATLGYLCSLDGGAYASCNSSTVFTGLAPGSHTLLVRAVDAWGNTDATPATVTWSVSRIAITAGKFHECAINDAGAVVCWGDNGAGKLGSGEPLYSAVPVSVGGRATSLTSIAASQNHTCALSTTGEVLCWGGNYFGELGNDTATSSATPVLVEGLPGPAAAVAVGANHNCALTTTGGVYCWGINTSGQVGNGVMDYHGGVPVAVQGLTSGVAAIGTGNDHSCAVTTTGTLRCWGANGSGQLGNNTTTSSSVPVTVSGLTGVASVSGGLAHTCAVTTVGALYCWGENSDGQLGNGTTIDSRLPVRITLPAAVKSVAVGDYYTCAITTADALYCWGGNYWDTLGTGVTTNSRVTTPSLVGTLSSGVSRVSTGRTHACAVKTNGDVYCWGYNAYGGVGDGSTTDRRTPVRVTGLPAGMVAASAGNYHSCAISASRRAYCWGYYGEGQLGGGAKVGRSTPGPVVGLASGALEVKAALSHTCALNASRGVVCWGSNYNGKLGNDSQINSSVPVAVQGLSAGVATIAVGGNHSCAVNSSGSVYCWGDNGRGQLGNGTFNTGWIPTLVTGLPARAVALSAGQNHTCALTDQGAVYCWGADSLGALGNGATTSSLVPLKVPGLPVDIIGISGSLYHQCAVSASGSVYCWGNNLSGQLGDGTYTSRTSPVRVLGISTTPMKRVSAGLYHTCALSQAGGVKCWGGGNFGQLGDGYFGSYPYPLQVAGMSSGMAAMAAGSESCAVSDVGAVLCWGDSNFGQLGDGNYVPRAKPVTVLAPGGTGSLDANNWYLDLDSSKAKTIDTEVTPKVLTVSQKSLAGDGVSFDTTVKYKAAEYGKNVATYVFALVPAQFFSLVKTAPGSATEAQVRAKAGSGLVFAQLTPSGWTNAQGQLIALSQGTANASGGGANILNGTRVELIPGARFCVGYGTSATDMLNSESFREVLAIEGAASTAEGRPCILSGVFVDGPATSNSGTPVTFRATVIGIEPTGSIQFLDRDTNLGSSMFVVSSGAASATASLTTATLAAGTHSIGAAYGGDAQNAAATAEVPLLHKVSPATAGSTVVLSGEASSSFGSPVTFTATVTGNNPVGNVQFMDGATPLGAPAVVINGTALTTVSTLPVGTHSVSAAYSGDSANTPSTSNALSHRVYEALVTSATLTASATTTVMGSSVTFTATVTGNSPTGSVTFRDGTTPLATVPLVGGTASLTLTTLEPGQHAITAEYSGDANNQVVTSGATFHHVAVSARYELAVTRQGNGTGTVVSAPSGIDCGSVCSASYSPGASVVLTANPGSGSAFAGWTGACTGTGACTVSMSAAASVGATFNAVTTASGIQVSPQQVAFGGQSMNATAPAQAVTITNTGEASLTVTSVSASSFFAVSHDCGALAAAASCTANVTFTPTVQGSLLGTLTITTASGSQSIALSGTGERSLVTHYYRAILGRAPDAGGNSYWNAEAARVQALGVNVNEVWFAMAGSFFSSPEYLALNRDNAGFVTDLYTTFFNRAPDAAGLAYWKGQLDQGLPREVALAGFMFSQEFATFTQTVFGTTTTRREVDTVVDFYRGLLGSLPDNGGFNYWLGLFRTAQCQGGNAVNAQVESISSAFANSAQYNNRGRSNSQYVGDLYNAFLRRGGDLGGVQFWINQIASGANTREQVRQAFVASPEFQTRVAAIIAQGCLP